MQITKHSLPSGMTVLLEENHTAPVISFNVLVKVGSAMETDAEAGMCHVIEHMIFKGTPTRNVGAIARDVEASGGEINAYTSFDQTVFYINMAGRFAEKGLEILSDAVQNPLFDAEELARESEVICEEIRRGKDSPSHCVSENIFRDAFTRHTYGRPIIGFSKTVKAFTREQILDFYRKWYSSDNMTFIVVGDFKSNEMLAKIEQAFTEVSQELHRSYTGVPRVQTVCSEPPQTSLRTSIEPMNIQATHFMIGFHVPNIAHDDVPALDILAHILAGADSSRLEQVIKEKKRLVHNIYSYVFTPKDPGLFIVGGVMQQNNTLKAIDAIWEEIYNFTAEPPAADEMNRAKINIRSSEIYERETVGGEAAKLAYFLATTGTYDFEKRYFQMINDTTSDDIRAVAQKYLTPKNCTVTMVVPKDTNVQPTVNAIETACGYKIGRTRKPSRRTSAPKFYTLQNGIKLVVRENHILPIVAMYAAVPGGLRYESPKTNGISCLISKTITKGTTRRNSIEIAKKIESIAGAIEGFTGRNSMGLRTEFLSDKLYDGMGLFAEILCNTSFDESEVMKERAQQLESIRNQEDNLSSMAFIYFLKALYSGHPYSLRLMGEDKSVKMLTPTILKNHWDSLLNPSEMVISVVGDVSPSEIKKLATEWIVLKKKKIAKVVPITIHKPGKIISIEHIKKEKEQAHIVLGFLGTKLLSPDHYKLIVLNHILAGQGGRLFIKLRDQMSLAYAVNSMVQSGIEPGHFAIYIGTEPKKIATAITGIKEELKQIQSKPVLPEELERAQQYLVGTYELDLQRNSAIASSYALNELYGLGAGELERYPQKIMKVTREDILSVAKKYIDLNSYVLSVIRP